MVWKKNAIPILSGLASLLVGPISCALAAKKETNPDISVPWLALACTAAAMAGVCLVAFKKPSRAKGE